jgi:hypothetical protein
MVGGLCGPVTTFPFPEIFLGSFSTGPGPAHGILCQFDPRANADPDEGSELCIVVAVVQNTQGLVDQDSEQKEREDQGGERICCNREQDGGKNPSESIWKKWVFCCGDASEGYSAVSSHTDSCHDKKPAVGSDNQYRLDDVPWNEESETVPGRFAAERSVGDADGDAVRNKLKGGVCRSENPETKYDEPDGENCCCQDDNSDERFRDRTFLSLRQRPFRRQERP